MRARWSFIAFVFAAAPTAFAQEVQSPEALNALLGKPVEAEAPTAGPTPSAEGEGGGASVFEVSAPQAVDINRDVIIGERGATEWEDWDDFNGDTERYIAVREEWLVQDGPGRVQLPFGREFGDPKGDRPPEDQLLFPDTERLDDLNQILGR
ncbi:MAG: hypothetical protein ACFB2Z_12475 [Maricaulaceae bacterium]